MASKSRSNKKGAVSTGGKDTKRSGRVRQAKFEDENKDTLAWKVLSDVQTKEIIELTDVDKVQEKVQSYFQISQHECDLREASTLDYYVAALWWAKEQQFTNEQMSAFFTVAHTMLENIKEKQMNVVDNLQEFKRLFAGIDVEKAEASGGLECFDVSQAKAVTDYFYSSIFQHYKLYEFMFSATQAEEIIGTDLLVEVAPPCDRPWPPPLEEAIATEVHQEYIATPPPTPAAQSQDENAESTVEGAEAQEVEQEATSISGEEIQKEADLLAQLSTLEIKTIMQEVCDEMLSGLQGEVAQKIRDKENAFIARINKIHKVAEN